MFTFNGTGTRLYGKRDQDKDGWYTATMFFCLLYLPIVPLSCHRVRPLEPKGILTMLQSRYEMYPIDADVAQARNVYLAAYVPLATVLLIIYCFG